VGVGSIGGGGGGHYRERGKSSRRWATEWRFQGKLVEYMRVAVVVGLRGGNCVSGSRCGEETKKHARSRGEACTSVATTADVVQGTQAAACVQMVPSKRSSAP
jgi:hypothetical protein